MDSDDRLTAREHAIALNHLSATAAEVTRHAADVRAGKFVTRAQAQASLEAALSTLVRGATVED